MAFKVIWARSALADLEQIVRYIATEDADAARRLGLALISRIEETAAFPRKGRVVPEKANDTLREIIFAPYRIVYEISDGNRTIQVLRVWHSARGAIPQL
jgi:toxin ParE1/3/4